jgi:zinc transport system substrate-binding protein
MRRTYLLVSVLFIATAFGISSCSKTPDFWKEATAGQKRILVSFPPLYAITAAIAGEDAYVLCMLTTQGPHDYDGGPTDRLMLEKADLFIFNGLSLDDNFAEKMLNNHRGAKPATLNVGEVLDEDHHNLLLHTKHDPDHKHEHHGHKHGDHDPHVWLGPAQAIAMTKIIQAKLAEIDPKNKMAYEERANKFIDELKDIKTFGDEAFKDKKHTNIITMHEAFAYFGQRKNFPAIKIVASIQTAPGVDPDAAAMARLVKKCREENVGVIAVEPQYSSRQAESLQTSLKRENVNVKIVTLDPMETAPLAGSGKMNPDPAFYLKKMRENIDALAKALP